MGPDRLTCAVNLVESVDALRRLEAYHTELRQLVARYEPHLPDSIRAWHHGLAEKTKATALMSWLGLSVEDSRHGAAVD